MNLNEIIKDLPKDRVKQDTEIQELYNYLKTIFEQGKNPAQTNTSKQEDAYD